VDSKYAPVTGNQKLHGFTHRGRLAGVAVLFALVGALLAVPSVSAQGGGIAPPGEPTAPAPAPAPTGGTYSLVQKATWYGPGLWGARTACGMKLAPTTLGVAHKSLPCGTQVTFSYGGNVVPATVIDRGPFRKGYAWDLTKLVAKRLGFLPVGAGKVMATVTPAP
jgi:hypothetical protein